MGITSDLLKVSFRGLFLAQQVEVVQYFKAGGAGLVTSNCAQVAEAAWNNVKTVWRGMHTAVASDKTISVLCEEIGGSLGFGEYPIPSGEQEGTYSPESPGNFLPPFSAVGVRLTVSTRTTRPGQKRFWGIREGDNADGELSVGLVAVVAAMMDVWVAPWALGAPAAVVILQAEVVKSSTLGGGSPVKQDVTGYIVNSNVSSQVSRKYGRGV